MFTIVFFYTRIHSIKSDQRWNINSSAILTSSKICLNEWNATPGTMQNKSNLSPGGKTWFLYLDFRLTGRFSLSCFWKNKFRFQYLFKRLIKVDVFVFIDISVGVTVVQNKYKIWHITQNSYHSVIMKRPCSATGQRSQHVERIS